MVTLRALEELKGILAGRAVVICDDRRVLDRIATRIEVRPIII